MQLVIKLLNMKIKRKEKLVKICCNSTKTGSKKETISNGKLPPKGLREVSSDSDDAYIDQKAVTRLAIKEPFKSRFKLFKTIQFMNISNIYNAVMLSNKIVLPGLDLDVYAADDGVLLFSLTLRDGKDQIMIPLCVDVHKDNKIYVTAANQSVAGIFIYNINGALINKVLIPYYGDVPPVFDIKVNALGLAFVTNPRDKSVDIYQPNLTKTFQLSVAQHGRPYYIGYNIHHKDILWLSFPENGIVLLLDLNNIQDEKSISLRCSQLGVNKLSTLVSFKPAGIFVTNDGWVFITDYQSGQVILMNFNMEIFPLPSEIMALKKPVFGMQVDNVFVTLETSSCLKFWRMCT